MSIVQSPWEEGPSGTIPVVSKGPVELPSPGPSIPTTTPGKVILELLLARADAQMSNVGAGAPPALWAETRV